jgi:hypothetical protein
MVNNTSGGINFLVRVGVLPPPHPSLPLPPPLRQYRVGPPPSRHGGVYSVVHSHAVKARMHLRVRVGRGGGGGLPSPSPSPSRPRPTQPSSTHTHTPGQTPPPTLRTAATGVMLHLELHAAQLRCGGDECAHVGGGGSGKVGGLGWGGAKDNHGGAFGGGRGATERGTAQDHDGWPLQSVHA